jgi:hypothetical protein
MFMAILSWCHWLQKNPFATSIRQPELLFSLMATLEIGALDAFYYRLPQEPWFSFPIRPDASQYGAKDQAIGSHSRNSVPFHDFPEDDSLAYSSHGASKDPYGECFPHRLVQRRLAGSGRISWIKEDHNVNTDSVWSCGYYDVMYRRVRS